MPKGMPRSQGSSGENIQHFSHLRLRVVGSGNLRGTLYSLDDVRSRVLPVKPITPTSRIEPTILTNFVEQRARYKMYTTDENEWFRVNRIIVFMKDFGSEYPG